MKRSHIFAGLALATLGAVAGTTGAGAGQRSAAAGAGELVYFGTQANEPEQGIYAARLDPRSGHLTPLGRVADIARPTWLVHAPGGKLVYAVSEVGNDGKSQASVYALKSDAATGALTVLNHVESGGGGATHLTYDARSRTVFVANYGTGTVAALPVRADGSLAPAASVQQDEGTGPSPRQKGPHAHGVTVDPSGRYLLAADLGADKVFVYRHDARTHALTPGSPPAEALPPGSGPRHLVFHPNGRFAFLLNELTADLRTYRWDAAAGRLSTVATLSTTRPDFTGAKSGAELAFSADGRHLYVSNRGEGSIIVYAVDGASGALTEQQRIASSGIPWSFGIDPSGRWLLVATQTANLVAVYRVDPATGLLTATAETLPLAAPVRVDFPRR